MVAGAWKSVIGPRNTAQVLLRFDTVDDALEYDFDLGVYKALRHLENLFIQRFLFIHPRFVFIVQGSLLVVQ